MSFAAAKLLIIEEIFEKEYENVSQCKSPAYIHVTFFYVTIYEWQNQV